MIVSSLSMSKMMILSALIIMFLGGHPQKQGNDLGGFFDSPVTKVILRDLLNYIFGMTSQFVPQNLHCE